MNLHFDKPQATQVSSIAFRVKDWINVKRASCRAMLTTVVPLHWTGASTHHLEPVATVKATVFV